MQVKETIEKLEELKQQLSYFQDIAIEGEISAENKEFFDKIDWHKDDEVDYAKKIIPELEAEITELEDKITLAKILKEL